MSDRKNLQGVDPKGQVFSGLSAILYAAESPISGGYIDQSRVLSARVDTFCGGLRGKRVLDVGCGYGTTTMAFARHAPRKIVAVDLSLAHLGLLQTVLKTEDNIKEYLISKNAQEVLDEYFSPTVAHLESMRREYWRGVFCRNNGELQVIHKSSLELNKDQLGYFDVIVGNNFLHWPVNQLRAKYEKETGIAIMPILDRAFRDALYPLVELLWPDNDSYMAFLEPKDFVVCDMDEELDSDLESMTMSKHPVYLKTQDVFNKLLLQRYKIIRPVTKTTALFRLSQMDKMFEEAGLKLHQVGFSEGSFACNPIDAFFVRMPMWLGSLDLSFDEKLVLMKDTKKELKSIVTLEDMSVPVRNSYFVFLLKRNY